MHQIVLSENASSELAQLNKLDQLEIVAEFSRLRKSPVEPGKNEIGEIHKGNRILYRCRYNEYRIYFEKKGDQLIVHHVLHGNTMRDFLVRSNLNFKNDEEFEKSAKFWKFIEQQQLKYTPTKS